MNYLKTALLAITISTLVLTGCANAEAALPSGIYVTNVQLNGQRDVLVIDWANNWVAYLKDGRNEACLTGRLSLREDRVTCVFDERGMELSFLVLKDKALQYQGNKTGEIYDLQMTRDMLSNPVFEYSWMETAKLKWKSMVFNYGRDLSKGSITGR